MMDTEDAARGESAVIFRGARAAHARTGPALGKGRPRLTDRERRPGDRALVERSRDHHHSISKPIRANRGRMIRLGRCQTDPYVLFQPRIVLELKML